MKLGATAERSCIGALACSVSALRKRQPGHVYCLLRGGDRRPRMMCCFHRVSEPHLCACVALESQVLVSNV